MNLNTSDQRIKKHTVSISNDVLKKIQRSVNKKINNLRAQGKLNKASSLILCLFALSLFDANAVTTFTDSFDNDNSNWGNTASEPVTWVASGGADGGGYITTSRSFSEQSTTTFRAHNDFFLPDRTASLTSK